MPLTMKLLMGSRAGWLPGLPGHELGAGLGQPNCGDASSAVSSSPSFGSEQPFCAVARSREQLTCHRGVCGKPKRLCCDARWNLNPCLMRTFNIWHESACCMWRERSDAADCCSVNHVMAGVRKRPGRDQRQVEHLEGV